MQQQLELFRNDSQVTELCVDAITRDDDDLKACARALLTLIRYHEAKHNAQATA